MGKSLESFAVKQCLAKLDLPDDIAVPPKNKRRTLFDAMKEEAESSGYVSDWQVDCEDMKDMWGNFKDAVPGFPDSLAFSVSRRKVWMIEIEDTHPLSEDKLDLYSYTQFYFDLILWELVLVVTDRYGASLRQIDLLGWRLHRHEEAVQESMFFRSSISKKIST